MLNLKKLWNFNTIKSNQAFKNPIRYFHNLSNYNNKENTNPNKNRISFSYLNYSSFLKFQKKYEIKKHRSFEKCNIIQKLEDFFGLLLNESKSNLYTLLKNEDFPFDANFIINSYTINKYIFKDLQIENLLNKIIINESKLNRKSLFSSISNKEQIFQICELFAKSYLENNNDPLGKRMMEVLKNKSYLMEKTELLDLMDSINENLLMESEKNKDSDNANTNENNKQEKKNLSKILHKYADMEDPNDPVTKEILKRKEKADLKNINFLEKENIKIDLSLEQKEKLHIDKNNIKIDKNKIKFSLNLNKSKATIRSKHFKPKVYIYAFDDYTVNNILPVFEVVDKTEANVILFQERPVPNINQEDIYHGFFDKSRIKAYYKEILCENKDKYEFNKINKVVWTNVDELRCPSYVNSLFLKAHDYSKINPNIKFLFIDTPIHKEIQFLFNFYFGQASNEKSLQSNKLKIASQELLAFLQLNKIYEKFFWLTHELNGECPVCNPEMKLEKAFNSLENLMDNYLLSLPDNVKSRNFSDKIINAMNLFKDEDKILVFVKESSFLNIVNQVLKDLTSYEEDEEIKDLDLGKYTILQNLRTQNKDIYSEYKEEELGLELFDYEFDKELFTKLIKNYQMDIQRLSILMSIYSEDKIKHK